MRRSQEAIYPGIEIRTDPIKVILDMGTCSSGQGTGEQDARCNSQYQGIESKTLYLVHNINLHKTLSSPLKKPESTSGKPEQSDFGIKTEK